MRGSIIFSLKGNPASPSLKGNECLPSNRARMCYAYNKHCRAYEGKETERQIDHCIRSLSKKGCRQGKPKPSDVEILNWFPGVGRVVLAAIFGEIYELVCRRDYRSLRNLGGCARQPSSRKKAGVLPKGELPWEDSWTRSTIGLA